MRTTRFIAGISVALVLAALLAACNERSSSGRNLLARPPTAPDPNPVPFATRLDVEGPATVPPGGSVQFKATVHMSDQSTRDVTNEAVWRSSLPEVLSISNAGLATGNQRGEATITVVLNHLRINRVVMVLPDGTFKLSGSVREENAQGFGVAAARVEVMSGPYAGLATTADAHGHYRIYGVAGDVQIRASQAGYQPQVKQLTVTGHQGLGFELNLSAPRADVSGTYSLTITASASCSSALPTDLRTRTYSAVITQDGARLTSTLSGADFYVRGTRGDRFIGRVEPTRVVFWLHSEEYYYYYQFFDPYLVERLTSSSVLAVAGSVVAAITPVGLIGPLNGEIKTATINLRGGLDTTARCRAADHAFVLER